MEDFEKFLELHRKKIGSLRDNNANEANTKSNLIDPLLKYLGWDIHNIEEVEREKPVLSKNIVDYALKIDGQSKLYVEAKKIQDDLTDFKDISKAVSYANDDGIAWCIITNGNLLHLYKPQEPGDLAAKKVLEIDIFGNSNLEFLQYFQKSSIQNDELSSHLQKILNTNEVVLKLDSLFEDPPEKLITIIRENISKLTLDQVRDSLENISASFENILINVQPSPTPVDPTTLGGPGSNGLPQNNIIRIPLPRPRLEGTFPAWKKYSFLDIPKKFRRFFPGYKIPFTIQTDVGTFETHITGAYADAEEGDADAGWYLSKGFSKFYRNHPDLEIGDIIIFTNIAEKKYKLDIEKMFDSQTQ